MKTMIFESIKDFNFKKKTPKILESKDPAGGKNFEINQFKPLFIRKSSKNHLSISPSTRNFILIQ